MGTLTLTPQYSDYGANTWASNPNMVATQAVIANACDILSRGLFCPLAANKTFVIDFGNNAQGPSGDPVGSGAQSSPTLGGIYSYATFRAALLSISSPNSIQQIAWNSTSLPTSDPTGDWPNQLTNPLAYALGLEGLLATPNAYVGIASGSYTDLDVNGLGAGTNYFEAVIHEVTECIGRRVNQNIWWYDGVGSHQIIKANPRYMSYDNGTLASKIYQMTTTGSDIWDTDGSVQTSYSAFALSGAVSRSSVLPLFANDWITLAVQGWALTTQGKIWAGIPDPILASFSPGLKR
jgi:hypothetical protein